MTQVTKKQVITKIETLNVLDAKQLETIKKETLKNVVSFYQTLLTDLLTPLGMPNAVISTLSIDKLETLAKDFIDAKKVSSTKNKSNAMKCRQIACVNAVQHINETIGFPLTKQLYKNIVRGFYAFKYFELNGFIPTCFESVETLFKNGFITTLNGADKKTAFDDLKRNGGFAGADSYSKTHIRSTHNYSAFTFLITLSPNDGLIHYSLK